MKDKDILTRRIIDDKKYHIQQAIWYLTTIAADDPIAPHIDKNRIDATIAYLTQLSETLTTLREGLPIGKRYTGTFYLRKAGTSAIDPEYDKITGTLLMPTGGSRWYLEHVEAGEKRYGHYICVFQSVHPEVPIDETKAVIAYENDSLPWVLATDKQ